MDNSDLSALPGAVFSMIKSNLPSSNVTPSPSVTVTGGFSSTTGASVGVASACVGTTVTGASVCSSLFLHADKENIMITDMIMESNFFFFDILLLLLKIFVNPNIIP